MSSVPGSSAVASHRAPASGPRRLRRWIGASLLAVAVVASAVWFGWRLVHLGAHPLAWGYLLTELGGFVGGVVVAVALADTDARCHTFERRHPDSHWFALATADLVGRTSAGDLRARVGSVVRHASRRRASDAAGVAMAAVLLDGPRRLAMVAIVAPGLLLGVAPFPVPPWWAVAAAGVAYGSTALALVAFGCGRLRLGDRLRWSYGAIGEVVGRREVEGHAPRRWLGAMAVAVGLSVAIALRGVSDRWTHGLATMDIDDRLVVLTLGVLLVLGALYTIRTSPHPEPAAVSRRRDERTGRQWLLAMAVAAVVLGLFAGLGPSRGHDAAGESWITVSTEEVRGG